MKQVCSSPFFTNVNQKKKCAETVPRGNIQVRDEYSRKVKRCCGISECFGFENSYPEVAPTIRFLTRVTHPNVKENGEIKRTGKDTSIVNVLKHLRLMFYPARWEDYDKTLKKCLH